MKTARSGQYHRLGFILEVCLMARQDTGVYEWREGVLRTLHAVGIDWEGLQKLNESIVDDRTLFVYWDKTRTWYFRWSVPLNSGGTIRCTSHADVLYSVKFFIEMGFKLKGWSPPAPRQSGQS